MQRVKTVVTLLLIGLWLPCTMHCQAETLGWLGADSTCCEPGQAGDSSKPDCGDCAACTAVESGGFSRPENGSFVHALLAVVVHLAPDLLVPARDSAELTPPAQDSTPQFLRQSWSFHCRTAPAPRAPSFLA